MTRSSVQGTLARLLLAAGLLLAGARAYRGLLAPDPAELGRLARAELRTIFGPGAQTTGFHVDLVDGVAIDGLSVRDSGADEHGLVARRVRVRHHLLDLVSGLYHPLALEVEGARISMHETPAGLAPDFPFRLRRGSAGGEPPDITVTDSALTLRARPGSERLAPDALLQVQIPRLTALSALGGGLSVAGRLHVRGLGQDDVPVVLGGTADPRTDALDLLLVWDPLTPTPQLRRVLADEWRERIEGTPLKAGRLEVHLERSGETDDELRVTVRWLGSISSDIGELPGLRDLSAEDKARLRELFGGGTLDLGMERGTLTIHALTARVGEAGVTASGWVGKDGDALELVAHVTSLSLTDPALRRALGPEGEEIFGQMEASGMLDADITISKRPGEALTWGAAVRLSEGRFRYWGTPTPEGEPMGFPYLFEQAAGALRIGPEGILIDGIEGRHGERTTLRVLAHERTSWQGEETGYVRFGPEGASLRLTIEALDMPVDDDLAAAVEGSEFHGLLDTYRVGGVIDRTELDLVLRPGIDTVVRSEVRVTLDDDRFSWARFPVPLENVRGVVMLTRPGLREPGRERDPTAPWIGVGRRFYIDARAQVAQAGGPAPVTVHAEVDAVAETGRLTITAQDLDLAGPLDQAVRTAPLTADGLAEIWDFLGPRGTAHIEGDFPLEEDPGPLKLLGRLDGVSVTLDAPAGPPSVDVVDIHGVLRAVGDDVRTHGLTGAMLGTPLEMEGAWPEGGDGPWSVDLKTHGALPLTLGFLTALDRLSACTLLLPYGLAFEPGGQAALDVSVRQERAASCAELTRLRLSEIDLALRWPAGPAIQVRGDALEVNEGEVTAFGLELGLPGLSAKVHEGSYGAAGLLGKFTLALDAFELEDEFAELVAVEDRESVLEWIGGRALSSPALDVRLDRDGSLTLRGALALVAAPDAPPGGAPRGRVTFEDLRLSGPDPLERRTWSGALALDGLHIQRGVDLAELVGRVEVDRLRLGEDPAAAARLVALTGRLEGARFEALTGPILWSEGLLTIDPLTATLAGGALAGRLRMHTRAPESYEGRLVLEGFDLSRLSEDLTLSGDPLKGAGRLELAFENRTLERRDLRGEGSLRIRDGHLADLPVAMNLFLALGSLLPNSTPPSIERADAVFTIRDDALRFGAIELAGPLSKIRGRGRLTLSGSLDVTFTPDVIKGLLLPMFMPIPVLGDALARLLREDLIYAVRVHGPLEDPRIDVVMFPLLGLSPSSTYEPPPALPEPPRRLPSAFR